MEDDTWSFALSTTSSRSYQSVLRSLSDLCVDFEEVDDADINNNNNGNEYEDDDVRAEYSCPFCNEDFDLVELCCHIDDEHPFEAKPEICSVFPTRVGANMLQHMTTQRGNLFKRLQKFKLQKEESYSTLSLLKKELEDGYFQSLLDAPPPVVSSSKLEPDPLLSFLYNAAPADKSKSALPQCATDLIVEGKSSEENISEREVHQPALSDKEQIEKGRRSEFVQGLLLSKILDDGL